MVEDLLSPCVGAAHQLSERDVVCGQCLEPDRSNNLSLQSTFLPFAGHMAIWPHMHVSHTKPKTAALLSIQH